MLHKNLLIWTLLLLFSCKTTEALDLPVLNYTKTTIPYKSILGVAPDLLSLDIYYDPNNTQSKPVIIWVHGGGWCIGDKSNQMANKTAFFAQMGYILVSVNYRLSPFPYALQDPNRIKFPIHNQDLADALKWVYDHIDSYGGDPHNLGLLGHSAGAHLVALTGTNQSFIEQAGFPISSIKGIAVIDTEMYDVYHVIQEVPDPDPMYLNAFGDIPQDNLSASPLHHLNHSDLPKFFIAKRGTIDRIAAADQFISALKQEGFAVTDIEANMYTHSEINEAIGQAGEIYITPALKVFFENCFK